MRKTLSTLSSLVRQPMGLVSIILIVILAFFAIFGPIIWGAQADLRNTDLLSQGSMPGHPLGTDASGRDNLARLFTSTRLTLVLSLIAVAIGVTTGVLLGTAPALLPKWMGQVITTLVNIAIAFPALLLALFFAVVFGVGATGAVLAIGFAMAPGFARLAHTLSASVATRDYISAARISGVSRFRVLFRHILPNIAEPLVINTTIAAGSTVTAFAGLSFLGVGVQPPEYDWGRLLFEGISRLYLDPVVLLGPAIAVIMAGLAFNLLGESIARVLGGRATRLRFTAGVLPARVVPAKRAVKAVPADGGKRERQAKATDGYEDVMIVDNLEVSFPGPAGTITPVRGVSFRIGRGEAVGVVGESGSGKSLTALAAARLFEEPTRVTSDRIEFCGTEIGHLPASQTRHLLGTSLAMVFQDPMTSFNPTRRIGSQLAEGAIEHEKISKKDGMARAIQRLQDVRVPGATRRAHQYPHEFSGGMRQRAMIAMGIMMTPSLIIADEPTTALDVTVQRQVLRLLKSVRDETGAAIMLISHDIAVVAQTTDRVLVMYAGRIVEEIPSASLRTDARHPYTQALLGVIPELDTDRTKPLQSIPGRPPAAGQFPVGCAFADRCPLATQLCREKDPVLEGSTNHRVACWNAEVPSDDTTPVTEGAAR